MLVAKPSGNRQEINNPKNNKLLKQPIFQNKINMNLHKSGHVSGEDNTSIKNYSRFNRHETTINNLN